MTFFDSAYQGFASGSLDKDAAAVRYFASEGFEMFVSQSFAKNMGLYGERAGCFHIVCHGEKEANCSMSQLKRIVRANYSNPPKHGAEIVYVVLSNPDLRAEWYNKVSTTTQILQTNMKCQGTGIEDDVRTNQCNASKTSPSSCGSKDARRMGTHA